MLSSSFISFSLTVTFYLPLFFSLFFSLSYLPHSVSFYLHFCLSHFSFFLPSFILSTSPAFFFPSFCSLVFSFSFAGIVYTLFAHLLRWFTHSDFSKWMAVYNSVTMIACFDVFFPFIHYIVHVSELYNL